MIGPAVDDLVGMAAGSVCRVLDNPAGTEIEPVAAAAQEIAYDSDRMMSAWVFTAMYPDGTTAWRSPSGSEVTTVGVDGSVEVTHW